jgi:hypothetical protein
MKRQNMKRTNNILIAALAGIALSLFAGSTQAQVKGGEQMMQLNGSAITATAMPGNFKPMSCAKCQDVATNARDITAKGASALAAHGVPAKTTVTHLCDGCVTTTTTVGVGKHAKDVVTHTCSNGGTGSSTCCSTTK